MRSRQAEFDKEMQRRRAEIQKQHDCLIDELKMHNDKEQSNREREQQADGQHKLNLEQIQTQADKLKRKLEDHDKQRPVDIQREAKSAQQVFILISTSL